MKLLAELHELQGKLRQLQGVLGQDDFAPAAERDKNLEDREIILPHQIDNGFDILEFHRCVLRA